MAKKVWDLKHTKVTLTSNRREIIVEYKDIGTFKSSVWEPIRHDQEIFDRKGFGRFHPLGWNSKKPKVFNFQATN